MRLRTSTLKLARNASNLHPRNAKVMCQVRDQLIQELEEYGVGLEVPTPKLQPRH